MWSYLNLVKEVLHAPYKGNRTGVKARSISGYMLQHDMSEGFPLLTTKKMPLKIIAVELEGFIKGITDKKWFQERGCNIWNEWASPNKVPYGHDEETKANMMAESDLGPIYGYQWRNFNGDYFNSKGEKITEEMKQAGYYNQYNTGTDQLAELVNKLHTNPLDRRMIVSAWNPNQLHQMALPPCHLMFQVVVTGENADILNLNWYQRSCDLMLGIPFNVASYAMLLLLLAAEAGMKPGKLCGMLGDVHIYENHIKGAVEQLMRDPLPLPTLEFPGFSGFFDWDHTQRKLNNYQSHPKIEFPIAV